MSDDAKPAYLRGRGSRGRGIPHHPTAGDRIIQRPGRQNIGWRYEDALSTDNKRSQDSTTSSDQSGGTFSPPYLKHDGTTPGQYYRQRRRNSHFKSVFIPAWLVFSAL